jgi:acyl transferase domain-containing protein
VEGEEGEPVVGVYVGLCNNEWPRLQGAEGARVGPHTGTGSAQGLAANRLSHALDLRGPSLTVDAACASSLAALHTAAAALRAGDCDFALVAAADLLLSAHALQLREAAHMLSRDGCTRPFLQGADGYARGEGAAAVVLCTARAARVWGGGAQLWGAVCGSSMNQCGRGASLTAPSGSAQSALLRAALARSGLRPADVCYIEAHGTGNARSVHAYAH